MSLEPAQVIGSLRECFRDGLPRYTLDARYQGLASWVVAAQSPDAIRTLPYFWQKSAATTTTGCRLVRGIGCAVPSRSNVLDRFCIDYIEWLWELYGRKAVAMLCIGQNAIHKFDFPTAYDALWTWMLQRGLI